MYDLSWEWKYRYSLFRNEVAVLFIKGKNGEMRREVYYGYREF